MAFLNSTVCCSADFIHLGKDDVFLKTGQAVWEAYEENWSFLEKKKIKNEELPCKKWNKRVIFKLHCIPRSSLLL